MRIEILDGQFMIREWCEDDAACLVKYANNPKIALNLRDAFPYPYGLEDAKTFLGLAMKMDPKTYLAIATRDEAIGSIGMTFGQDVHRYTAEMGYWLAESFWGRGIITAAVKAFTKWAFDSFELNRIFAEPYTTNPASARVLEKAGFTLEGTLRSMVVKNGQILDQWMYAHFPF